MVNRTMWLKLAFVCAVVLVPAATGTQQVVSGTGLISGSGTSYKLRITNTGTEPLTCWRLTLRAGVMFTAIGPPPAGWQVGSPGPSPQPALAGKGPSIPPGGFLDFPFTTDTRFPAGLSDSLRISADCKSDADAVVTGPTSGGTNPPPQPTTPTKVCKCRALTARINPKSFELDKPRSRVALFLRFDLDWTLRCTGGAKQCRGTMRLRPEPKATLSPKGGKVTCNGKCGRTTSGYQRFNLIDPALKFGSRSPNDAVLFLARTCAGKVLPTLTLAIRFNQRTERVDLDASDLNGNGIPDGKKGG